MGCQGCRRSKNLNSTQPNNTTTLSAIDMPIVYVVCRGCGTLRAMRFNLATQFVKTKCEICGKLLFFLLKQPPTPETLKRLLIMENNNA
jgi:hypothetical protein